MKKIKFTTILFIMFIMFLSFSNISFAFISKENRTVFLGDSLMDDAWPRFPWPDYATWKSAGKIYMLKNDGISGTNTGQFLARLGTDVWPYNPDVLVYMASGNDWNVPLTLAQSQANLTAIADAAKARGVVPILVTLGPLAGFSPAQVQTVNTMVKQVATAEGIQVFDIYSVVADVSGNWKDPTWTSDGIHTSIIGAGVIGSAFVASSAYAAVYGTSPTRLSLTNKNSDPNTISTNNLFQTTTAGTGLCAGQTVPSNWGCNAGNPGGTVTTPTFSFINDGTTVGSWYRIVMPPAPSSLGYWQMSPGVTVPIGHVIDVSFRIRISGMNASSHDNESFALQNNPGSAPLSFAVDIDGVGHARFTATSSSLLFWYQNTTTGTTTVDLSQFAVVDLTAQGAGYSGVGTWVGGMFPLPMPVGAR